MKNPDKFRQNLLYQAFSRWINVPYRWGGKEPSCGLDCSGFVQMGLEWGGIMPCRPVKSSGMLFDYFEKRQLVHLPDDRQWWLPGNLLFFGKKPKLVKHVSFYVGRSTELDIDYILDCGRGGRKIDTLLAAHTARAGVQIRQMIEMPHQLLGIVDIVEAYDVLHK